MRQVEVILEAAGRMICPYLTWIVFAYVPKNVTLIESAKLWRTATKNSMTEPARTDIELECNHRATGSKTVIAKKNGLNAFVSILFFVA